MSSASMSPKSRLFAYHREFQLRVTARRKPVGWIFCPMCLPALVADGHVHVARTLADAVAAALGARGETLQHGALLHVDALHAQLVDVDTVVVFGVRDRGLQNLLDDDGTLLLGESQDVEGLVHLLAADQVGHETALVDRQAHAPEGRFGFSHGSASLLHDFFVGGVTLEGARQGEFAQLVAHHLVGDVDRHVLLAVVNGDGQADEIGQDHRAARPGLDRLLVLDGNGLVDLRHQVVVHERTLLERTRHVADPLLLAARDDERLRALVVTRAIALGQVAPRVHRMAAFAGLAFAATVRVVDRVHHHAADGRADAHVALDSGFAQLAQAVFFVGDFTDGGAALDGDLAHFAGPPADLRVRAFAGQQRCRGTRRTRDLRALAGLQLDAVDR